MPGVESGSTVRPKPLVWVWILVKGGEGQCTSVVPRPRAGVRAMAPEQATGREEAFHPRVMGAVLLFQAE